MRVLENGPLAENAEHYGLKLKRIPDGYLIPLCLYDVTEGLTWDNAARLAALFGDKLSIYPNPLSKLMDVELYKMVLLNKHSKLFRENTRENETVQ